MTFGGYNLAAYAKPGLGEKDIFWAKVAHKKTHFWVVNMGQLEIEGGPKINAISKHMIFDSGLSYALIPSEDFKSVVSLLNNYGVKCEVNKDKTKENA